MDSEEDNVITIFMNLLNFFHAFTALQMEITLTYWPITLVLTYYTNSKNAQNSFYLEANSEINVFKRRKPIRKYWVRPGKNKCWWENFSSRKVVEEE